MSWNQTKKHHFLKRENDVFIDFRSETLSKDPKRAFSF